MRGCHTFLLFTAIVLFCDLEKINSQEFTYNGRMGPDHWGDTYNTCSGKHQSPININIVDVVNSTFWPLEFHDFDVIPASAELVNNGHTVVVKLLYHNMPPTISGGPLRNQGLFQFSQFHFHWGENNTVGSEDRINNVSFPAELHMVFYNVKYETFNEAVVNDDGVVVLAFFYALQENDNPNYAEFTELLNEVRTPDTHVPFRHPPKMQQLITDDVENYYTYLGSLTTPPCSEDVTWIDFATPIMISTKQIERFRSLHTHQGKPLTHNFRPIQPLNNRLVYRAIPPLPRLTVESDKSNSAASMAIFFHIFILSILVLISQ
ncbi:carbonic anhydrase 7 [Teleopsis dalmanni]|uniref:carbonic anhydrase 7 n=1 Tax=Teleopsis dalmanni TaxID=139649 RepID=UPI0018CD4867|nr:carbonic anhydrase 7 [Teleopsis dalmanni]